MDTLHVVFRKYAVRGKANVRFKGNLKKHRIEKFHKSHTKVLLLESFVRKAAVRTPVTLLKEDSMIGFSSFAFRNSFFSQTPEGD